MSSGGYAIDSGGTGGGNTAWITTPKITITTAQILAFNTTPQNLVLAQGANTIIVPVRIVKIIRFAGTAYTTNLNLQIRYTTTGLNLMQDSSTLGSTVTRRMDNTYVAPAGTTTSQYGVNENLIISVAAGNPLAGNSDMDIWVTYYVLNIA